MTIESEADRDAMLADFGVTCTVGATSFLGILNAPGSVVAIGDARSLSTDYELLYKSVAVTLRNDTAITVDGVSYRTRENARAVADGKFSRIYLRKV